MNRHLCGAVIGLGHGMLHARAYASNPKTRLVAVCDKYIDKAKSAADELDAPMAVDDYREVIADERVDIVSVATPDKLHARQAIAALQVGKQVVLEEMGNRTMVRMHGAVLEFATTPDGVYRLTI